MNYMRLITFVIVSSIVFYSCNCDDPVTPPPTDPCLNKRPVSAGFSIIEAPQRLWGDSLWVYYDTDTLACTSALFKAKEDSADYYEWHIGREIIKGQRSVQRIDFPVGADYEVTLIVHKKPDTLCFPNDDGSDTVTRKFHVLDTTKQVIFSHPWMGKFKGNSDDSFGERTIELRLLPAPGFGDTTWGRVSVSNLIPNCTTLEGCEWTKEHSGQVTIFKEVLFGSARIALCWCRGVSGAALVSPTNRDSITVRYSYRVNPIDTGRSDYTPYYTFKGKRVQ